MEALMKKLLVYLLLIFIAWHYYQKNTAPTEIEAAPEPAVAEEHDAPVYQEPELIRFEPSTGFSCDGRQYCSQMRSRPEAEYFLKNCPNTKMDGDFDGIPCENDTRF
jgi:hypothetical protein